LQEPQGLEYEYLSMELNDGSTLTDTTKLTKKEDQYGMLTPQKEALPIQHQKEASPKQHPREVSMMTTEANNLLRMITAATMESWNEEQLQIQSLMNGSESGSQNSKSQITLNNWDEWEISEWMGGIEENSNIEGVELVKKKDRRRFGDEKRWEQFSGNDESFQKK
ncbi:6508_t:CDS:1, partial [Paraglomus occultum]